MVGAFLVGILAGVLQRAHHDVAGRAIAAGLAFAVVVEADGLIDIGLQQARIAEMRLDVARQSVAARGAVILFGLLLLGFGLFCRLLRRRLKPLECFRFGNGAGRRRRKNFDLADAIGLTPAA